VKPRVASQLSTDAALSAPGRLVVEQVYDHQGNIGNGTVPLLVLDMWEHAHYFQYRNMKGDWVNAFWRVVNWEDVARRLSSVRTVDRAL
jgi:Fe-Mn family superoxide dismutase